MLPRPAAVPPARTTGPLFVTERKARVQLPAADLDEHGRARLSYQQAKALFTKVSGGATLHQFRHSALSLSMVSANPDRACTRPCDVSRSPRVA